MIQQPRPRGRRLWSLAAWSLGIGLAWLLLGQQYAGQPAVHLDLTAGLPGAATMHRPPAAPARPAPASGGQAPAPQRQTSPRSSTGTSTPRPMGTSPQSQHSTGTSTPRPMGTSPQSRHPTGTSTAASQSAARAVAFAVSQQGKPYEYGAEGPNTYDCSGLVWRAWQHAGLTWERRSAASQWQWLHDRGHQVPATKAGPGDLLFYANNPSDPASIHHVAMHVGNGRMVEAPAPGIPVRVVPVRQTELFAVARPIP